MTRGPREECSHLRGLQKIICTSSLDFVNGLVVALYSVAAVGIAVAEFDRLRQCARGHDALCKFSVSAEMRKIYVVSMG